MATSARQGISLQWQMLIGFLVGLTLGLIANATAADAAWVEWVSTYITGPIGQIFLRLIFMLVIPLLVSALIVGITEMGDIGALALGAALGTIAVIVRQELVALIMGGIFVVETASVIIQVASFKMTGKRVFRMAPIHHHYELKGWAEPKVIVRFWIISFILVLAGLATLKLR